MILIKENPTYSLSAPIDTHTHSSRPCYKAQTKRVNGSHWIGQSATKDGQSSINMKWVINRLADGVAHQLPITWYFKGWFPNYFYPQNVYLHLIGNSLDQLRNWSLTNITHIEKRESPTFFCNWLKVQFLGIYFLEVFANYHLHSTIRKAIYLTNIYYESWTLTFIYLSVGKECFI